MAIRNSSGQTRFGVRSPLVAQTPTVSTLLTGIYSIWDGEASGGQLDTSILNAWNAGTLTTVTTLNTSLAGAWNAERLYSSTTLTTNLLNVWNANGNTNDSCGTSNGTAVGGLTYSTGKVGSAFQFNGTDSLVSIPNTSGQFNFTGNFTINAWINIPNYSNNNMIFRNYVAGGSYGYGFTFYLATNNVFSFELRNGNSFSQYITNGGIATGSFKMITIVREVGLAPKIYIDGVLNTGAYYVNGNATNAPGYQSNQVYSIGLGSNHRQDNTAVWNRVLTQAEITQLYSGSNSEYPYLSSTNDIIGTNNGTPMGGLTYTTGKIGRGFLFEGTTSYITLPNDSFKPAGQFSINTWINLSTIGSIRTIMIACASLSSGFRFYVGTDAKVYFEYNGLYFNSLKTLSANVWYQIGITYDGTNYNIYINGSLDNSKAGAAPIWGTTVNNIVHIGRYFPSFGYYFHGIIDSISVWNKALTKDEMAALYNLGDGLESTYPESKSTYSKLLTDHVTSTDGISYGTLSYTASGKSGPAYNFNGSSYIDVGNTTLNFGTNSFSLSLWFNPTSGNVLQMLLSKGFWGGSISGFYLNLENRFNSNQRGISFGMNSGGYYSTNGTTSGFSYNVGSWNHVVVTWDSTAKSLKIYLNGVQATTSLIQGSAVSGISNISNSYAGLIGSYIDSNGTSRTLHYSGLMDSVVTWNKVISSTEVTQLYNNGNGGEYPFSSNLMVSPNNKFGMDNGTLVNATLTTGKIGNAFQFDGIDDYVALPNNSLNFTGDFSVSAWIYVGNVSGEKYIISNSNGNALNINFGWVFGLFDNKLSFGSYANTTYTFWTSTNSIVANTWYHVLVTKKTSQSPKFYINGVLSNNTYPFQNASTESTNPVYSSATYPNIKSSIGTYMYNNGSNSYGYWIGKLDALNVWTKELTQSEVTELYNSGNGKQLDVTSIVTSGLVLNLDASRKSSYPNTGTTWFDISGNGYDVTLTNGVTYGTTASGIMSFNGTTQFATRATISPTFTVGCIDMWIKPNTIINSSSDFSAILTLATSTTSAWYVALGSATSLISGEYITISEAVSSKRVCVTDGGSLSANSWVNLLINYESGQYKIYLNNVLKNTVTYNGGVLQLTTPNSIYIGCAAGESSPPRGFFNGDISNVKIYNRTLSSTEMTQNFNATKSRFGL
jgi:hypothetical protein